MAAAGFVVLATCAALARHARPARAANARPDAARQGGGAATVQQHQQPQRPEGPGGSAPPASFLIVHNVAKRHNIGNIIRSCAAFGVRAVFVAGRKKDTMFYGAKGTKSRVHIRYFESLGAVRAHCTARGIHVCGIEIMEEARPVHTHPWTGPTAFILGNEGQGLSPREKASCDSFVYISHYGSGTASLNVTVAGSIVLHHFGLWAGFTERPREGEKYVVAQPRNAGVEAATAAGPGKGDGGAGGGGGDSGDDGDANAGPPTLSDIDLAVRRERAARKRQEAAAAAAAMDSAMAAVALHGADAGW